MTVSMKKYRFQNYLRDHDINPHTEAAIVRLLELAGEKPQKNEDRSTLAGLFLASVCDEGNLGVRIDALIAADQELYEDIKTVIQHFRCSKTDPYNLLYSDVSHVLGEWILWHEQQ